MAKDFKPLDVTDTADILRLAEEVAATGVPRVLRRGADELAIIRPVSSAVRKRSRSRSSRSAAPNAWIEGLIGMAESAGPVDVSANVHAHVAEATRTEGHGDTSR